MDREQGCKGRGGIGEDLGGVIAGELSGVDTGKRNPGNLIGGLMTKGLEQYLLGQHGNSPFLQIWVLPYLIV